MGSEAISDCARLTDGPNGSKLWKVEVGSDVERINNRSLTGQSSDLPWSSKFTCFKNKVYYKLAAEQGIILPGCSFIMEKNYLLLYKYNRVQSNDTDHYQR